MAYGWKRKLESAGRLANKARKRLPSQVDVANAAGVLMSAAIPSYKHYSTKPSFKKVKGAGLKKTGSAKYVGKFKKPKRKAIKSGVKYSETGFIERSEQFGEITDGDCVYLMHCAVDPYRLVRVTVASMIRKLVKMAFKYDCASANEIIPTSYAAGETGIPTGIYVFGGNPTLADSRYSIIQSHTFIATDTCNTVAEAILAAFLDYSNGYTNNNDTNNVELYRIAIVQDYRDAAGTGIVAPFLAQLDLQAEMVHFTGTSTLKIQNRSLSTDGENLTDVVDTKPLAGRIYDFPGLPKARAPDSGSVKFLQGGAAGTGFRAWSSAGMGQDWRKPPLPRVFSNVKKASTVVLNPGLIKKISVRVTKKIGFLTLLRKLDYELGVSNSNYIFTMSPCQLVALEELMNSGTLNLINAGWECERYIGVCTKSSRRKMCAQSDFVQF